MTAFLEARNLTKVFGQGERTTVALENFSYSIDDNAPSITTVAGESGSGKSTLARLLLGFIDPTEGQVLYRGKDLRELSRHERQDFRRMVQAVFQDPFGVYNPFYKVDHLLTMPVRNFKLASSRADARDQIEQSLLTVGLNPGEILGRYPHQLSGGQRQRITIARALLLRPRLIIADEPVSMVDASLRATILESLLTLYHDFGISFIYITHDLTTAYQISERLIVLYQGTVAEAGPVEPVIKHPQHPYTQLLIQSIPAPDPDKRWGEDVVPVAETEESKEATVIQGCKFAPRCPFVMPICREEAPPLFRTGPSAASCYLHRDAPVVDGGDLMQIFNEPSPRAPAPVASER
ncbi:MAG TPA: ABC transporter ATP-binding protein [Thermomicrobiales bacterium]|nr:ABC transporter ATP-binding protein [Thermomicrobiales bacterium]